MFSSFPKCAKERLAIGQVLAFLLFVFTLVAAPVLQADDFLKPERAFVFSARMLDRQTAEVAYRIADGYYMYRERFVFEAEGAHLGKPAIPPGTVKFDETFQKDVETHRGSLIIRVPIQAQGPFTLQVTSQGCSEQGLCYAPMNSAMRLSPDGSSVPTSIDDGSVAEPISFGQFDTAMGDEMGSLAASLADGSLLAIIPLFLLLGIGLSFTPCVLPMVPILSSIIIGEGVHVSRARSFALSAAYSLGMAMIYTALGVAAGLAGEGMAAALQKPWVLGAFAVLMFVLSLSMFGVYQLQVPVALQVRLMRASDRQSGGKMAGVFTMGAISALIVGPCVAAPLAGVLLYISQTRDIVIGAVALFSMAAGMSVPLLLVGLSATTILPRAGAWMEALKIFFGVLMLTMAVWIVAPVTPAWATMLGWGALWLVYGTYLLRGQLGRLSKLAAVVFLSLGLVQLAGLATGGHDALAPLAHLNGKVHKTEFQRVKSIDELDAALATANGRIVLLDFYADWCVSCIEMEKLTFSDMRIRAEFANMLLLQADVTANNEEDKALLRRFRLFGPPGIIFFDGQGREIVGGRVIGFQNARKFTETLERVKNLQRS